MAKKKNKFDAKFQSDFDAAIGGVVSEFVHVEGTPVKVICTAMRGLKVRLNPEEMRQALWGRGYAMKLARKHGGLNMAAEWLVYPQMREEWSKLK